MSIYVRPGAYSRFVETAGSAILGSGTRIAAIIGFSLIYKIAEETIIRGSSTPYVNTADPLAHIGVTEILSVGNRPYSSDYTEGVDFQLVDDTIDWSLGGDEPSVGSKYYIRYKYSKVATDYEPKLLYSRKEAQEEYGQPLVGNELAIALDVYFDNGPAPVIAVQTDGITTTSYRNAIDALQYQIEGVDATHIIMLNTSDTLHSYLYTHVATMSDMVHRKERRAIISTAIATSSANMILKATAFADERVIYIPQWATRELTDSAGATAVYTLNGTYVACAIIGKLISKSIEESITNEPISGFIELGIEYLEEEADNLANNGILVLYSRGGILKVRHDISTSVATPEENQISILEIRDFLIKNVRDGLEKQWLAKPIYGAETIGNIERSTSAILDKMIEARYITDYSGISAEQNITDNRRIDVTFMFKPVYPLMWIYINFSYIKS